ncbi:MAG: type II toxin-antitoxin system VapC family toxin [Oscillospiraceae bacterium]|nr:type II toxin-antitoxin system VapC family toxin [Oscillospiraceae bacterium]
MYFLDTNTCVFLLSNKFKEKSKITWEHIRTVPRNSIKIPSVVLAELCHGAAKSKFREKTFEKNHRFLAFYEVVPFDEHAARVYGDIRAGLETKGQIIGGNDLMIAAIALTHNAILVTNNTREFSRIEGLLLEDWSVT